MMWAEFKIHDLLCVATSVHVFQQTFISAVFLVSLAGSEGERSSVETVGGKMCYTVGLVGSKYT